MPVRIEGKRAELRDGCHCSSIVKFLGRTMVGAPGFEPGASCAQGRRATRLRYAPTCTALFILKHFPTLLLIANTILSTRLHTNCACVPQYARSKKGSINIG